MSNLPAKQLPPVQSLVANKGSKIEKALPSDVTLNDFTRSLMVAVAKNPKLNQCKPDSLYLAVIEAAGLGLDCSGGVMGQAYLIPFKDTCQLIIGYKGLIDLARRAGEYEEFYACEVRQNDEFQYIQGTDRSIIHKPDVFTDRGEVIGFYAVAKTKGGATSFEFMSRAEVEKVRDGSNGWKSAQMYKKPSIWDVEEKGGYFSEMGKKTVIRRLIKMLPLSSKRLRPLVQAVALSDREFDFGHHETERKELPANLPPALSKALGGTTTTEAAQGPEKDAKVPENGGEAFLEGFSIEANPHKGTKAKAWVAEYETTQEKIEGELKDSEEQNLGGMFQGESE